MENASNIIEASKSLNSKKLEQNVAETIKRCQDRNEPPSLWSTQLLKCLDYSYSSWPSPELAQVLVSLLCAVDDNNYNNKNKKASLWKFLDHALSSLTLISPIHVLSLLTSRVISRRESEPEAYRLYLQLVSQYALTFDPLASAPSKYKILESIDDALQLTRTFKVSALDPGNTFVFFFFSIVTALIDATLADWGLHVSSLEPEQTGDTENQDHKSMYNPKLDQHREQLRRANSFLAVEMIATLIECRKAMFLLRLVHLNMPKLFNGLLLRMQFIIENKVRSANLSSANLILEKLSGNVHKVLNFQYKLNKPQAYNISVGIGSYNPSSCYSESSQFGCWVPFDIYMENAMDGKQLPVKSAIDVLTETMLTLRIFNQASWQVTFLELWFSALRLLQRERNPLEGPIPHLEARLCLLLSIVPLAIANVLEETRQIHETDKSSHASRKHELISSLQILGQFSTLLCPPASVACAANHAAAKAVSFVSNSKSVNDDPGDGKHDIIVKAGGNMMHLIVEACIARRLVDTSAYFWPGYISSLKIMPLDTPRVKMSPWSTFMEGSPLDGPLVEALVATPASSVLEIERIYHIALNGLEEEKSAAAKILCGASFSHGWSIQEHVVKFVVKLLSTPISPNQTTSGDHLVENLSMLSSILFGASSIDTVHILSLHGVIPEVAASLMPLCETFGSLKPNIKRGGEEPSVHVVFSCAFLFLLRLWKFYKPPLEQCIGGEGGHELSLEYLLLLRNQRLGSSNFSAQYQSGAYINRNKLASEKPIYIDYYPKLRAWYCQNKSCVASTLSGLCSRNPIHHTADKILSMLYQKTTNNGKSYGGPTYSSGMCDSSPSSGETIYQRPMLPAWELLEAIPIVLEAILTACAYGRLSSRDLTTGLRDLVDFLPASVAVIVSYFSAEITRGIWKPVPMNGTEWPSPAAILQSVESEMKEILAPTGVDVPSCFSGISPIMLPLPMAALVSLTITLKLEKRIEYILAVMGPALENCASGCPWPSMPIMGSLWAQKVRRWHDFIIVSCSLSLFRQNREAVVLLLRSCFKEFLGLLDASTVSFTSQGSVNRLLGNTVSGRALAPGFLFLRSCRTVHTVQYMNNEVIRLVLEYAQTVAGSCTSTRYTCLKSVQGSLSLVIFKVKEIATLGASLLFVTGGARLVEELYRDTALTWLLSSRNENTSKASPVSQIIEGYVMAYLLVLSGLLAWGVGPKPPSWEFSKRSSCVGAHMDFLARVFEGNISIGCDPIIWKSYVSCYTGLVVSTAPAWIQGVKLETLRHLASQLRGWHECECALSLLENGGAAAIGSAAELIDLVT